MSKSENKEGRNLARWPEHDHDLIHTFGVKDYDAYWNAAPMRKRMRPIMKRMSREIQSRIPTPAKLLELGPGPGHLFKHLTELGFEMYACDASQVSLDLIQAPRDHLKLADLNEGLPNFGTKFSGILAALVLHHISKPDSFLAQLRTALEPGGHLLITTPNIVHARNRLRMMVGKFPKLSPSHRNFMTPEEISKLLCISGFKVLSCLSSRRRPLQTISPKLFSKELLFVARVE